MSEAQVNAHLKKFAPEQRKILIELRDHIASKLPSSEQVIKYGIPTFLINGIAVVGFDGYKGHNSLFPYSGSFNVRLKKELEKYLSINPKSIDLSVGYDINFDPIQKLFDLYNPSIITFSRIIITIDFTNQFEKFKMLSTKAKDITIKNYEDLE